MTEKIATEKADRAIVVINMDGFVFTMDFNNMTCTRDDRVWDITVDSDNVLHTISRGEGESGSGIMFNVFQEAYQSYLAEKELLS